MDEEKYFYLKPEEVGPFIVLDGAIARCVDTYTIPNVVAVLRSLIEELEAAQKEHA